MTDKTPSSAVVMTLADLPVYERGGGARTTPLVSRAVGNPSFITGYTDFDVGAKIPFHSHNCEESVVLVEGDAVLEIDGKEYRLKPLDCTYIPPDVPHRFRNLSETKPMKILWIYARADATRTLIESGATAPIAAEHHK